jgi:tetratricopeptide (TPR) repeat protein
MKRTLIFALITAALCAQLAVAQAGTSASATWQVQRYDIDVSLPQDSARTVNSKATVAVKNVSGRPASSLTLRISPNATVSSVRLGDAATDFTKNEEKINAGTSLQRIIVRLPPVPADGQITATVEYKLDVKENNALATLSPVGSHLLPLSFWYPTPNSWYFTKGADAAPFRLRVAAPAGMSVISSGAEKAGTYEQQLRAQPYLLAAAWDSAEYNGITVHVPKGMGPEGQRRASELAAVLAEARAFTAEMLGRAPGTPLRIVSARRGAGFSSAGTVVVDEVVFRRPKIDSLTVMNLAESAAKLWLGGSVAVTDEGHGVITEGLSRYIATQFIESKYGKDVADVERMRQRNAYAAVSRRDAPLASVSPLDDFYFAAVANKGAMVWRMLARRIGTSEFANLIRRNAEDSHLTLAELRTAFSSQKEMLDYQFDTITDMNLQIGLPQQGSGETKVALRNTGAHDVVVDVAAFTVSGERLTAPATIRSSAFGEVVFRTPAKINRVVVDVEKLYPQLDYSDDVAPRDATDSDPLLAVKRAFDKPDLPAAEQLARVVLRDAPRLDDVRVLLARSLLGQNKIVEAEREFRAVLDEKLPSARSLAWANVGLGEIAARAGQNDAALKYAETVIRIDAEYGASLAARNLRSRLGTQPNIDASVRAFFAEFDRAATANRKADVDALILAGEVARFSAGVAGSTERWTTQIRHVDQIDPHNILVETTMTIKLLNKDQETGMAVYRLTRVGNLWKLSGVEMFEVR